MLVSVPFLNTLNEIELSPISPTSSISNVSGLFVVEIKEPRSSTDSLSILFGRNLFLQIKNNSLLVSALAAGKDISVAQKLRSKIFIELSKCVTGSTLKEKWLNVSVRVLNSVVLELPTVLTTALEI